MNWQQHWHWIAAGVAVAGLTWWSSSELPVATESAGTRAIAQEPASWVQNPTVEAPRASHPALVRLEREKPSPIVSAVLEQPEPQSPVTEELFRASYERAAVEPDIPEAVWLSGTIEIDEAN